jgi:hypothetical protein
MGTTTDTNPGQVGGEIGESVINPDFDVHPGHESAAETSEVAI